MSVRGSVKCRVDIPSCYCDRERLEEVERPLIPVTVVLVALCKLLITVKKI